MNTKTEFVRINKFAKKELDNLCFSLRIKYPGDVIEYLVRKELGLSYDHLIVKKSNKEASSDPQ